jgi:hypothetical protein
MSDINVYLPKSGGVEVSSKSQPVMEDDLVYWHFRSDNPDVWQIEIAFEKAKATFFPQEDGGPVDVLKKNLSFSSSLGPKDDRKDGVITVWGRAPVFKKKDMPYEVRHKKKKQELHKLQREDKYTIRGLNQSGESADPEALLDPEIITDKPTRPKG